MKKRVLSLILAVLMVLSVLPVMTLSIAAEEQPEASAPAAEFSYNDLYVTDGLVAWFRAEDVNLEQPGTDAKGNEIYIVGLSYEEDGTLKTGQVQYKKDFLDNLGNGTPDDHNFGEDVTAQIVMSGLAVNDRAPLLNVGVSSVVPYNNALAHRIASWNVLDSQNNRVFWDICDDVNKLGTQSRLFAFTQKIDVTLDQYKYVDGAYKNANGETLNLGHNGSGYYYYVPNPLVKRAVFEAYLTVEGADQNNPENYASVKQYNEKKWSFAAVRRDSAQAFQTALDNAGITGFAVNTDLAKVIPAETDDLPFDGHMRLDEYLDGARLAFRGYAYNPAIPFTYGSYGDEFADENGKILTPEELADYEGEVTNTNETVWDGNPYKTGAESKSAAVAAVGDLAWGNANLFVGRSQAKLHDFRLYNKLLSEAEMKQNAFADLAKHKGLDKTALAILVKLPEEADRQEIYALFASYNLASDVDADTLDGILRPAVSKKYIALYDAQTEEEQTFKELFNGTDVDLCDFAVLDDFAKEIFLAKLANDDAREATQVYFDNLLKASSLDYSGYETVRKMFKEDLFDIYVASDDQADIDKAEAVYAGINFAEFDELSDSLKATVEAAMKADSETLKTYAIAGNSAGAQAWLDAKVDEAAEAIYSNYDVLYVKDDLYSHLSFLEVSKDELTGNKLDEWRNLNKTNDGAANALLQSYVKYGDTDYTFSGNGAYYINTDGEAVLFPTSDKPTTLVDGKLNSVRGNTFQFEDGYIVSPYHLGYYQKADGSTAALNSKDSSPNLSANANWVPGHQGELNTYIKLPVADSFFNKEDVTVQYVISYANQIVDGVLKGNIDTYTARRNRYTDFIYTPFGVTGITWFDTAKDDKDAIWAFGFREYVNGSWKQKEYLSGMNGLWPIGDYQIDDTKDFGVAKTYTLVSDIVTTEISESEACTVGDNKYTAKTKLNFYIDDEIALDEDYFGQKHDDGLLWLGAAAPNGHSIGSGGGLGLYAVRIYKKALNKNEIIQNQFADVVGFYHLDANVMLDIPEILWKQVYPIFEGVKLDDATQTKEALQSILDAKVAELAVGGGAVEVLKFEGYQARNEEYDGLRALYTVNEDKLAELKGLGYSVEFGAILAIADGRTADAIVGSVVDGDFALTVDKALSVKVYDGDRYTGKHFINDDTGETQFAYTLTFNAENAIKENFESEVIFRSYVVITKNGESTVVYPDNSSESFDDGLSYQKVAKKYYDLGLGYNKIVQKALAECGDITLTGKTYTINGNDLAEYTIVSAPDTLKFALSVREEIKKATGYTLPIVKEAEAAGLAINVAHNTKLEDGAWAVSFDDDAVIIGGHGVAETKQAVNEFIASFPESGGAIPTQQIAQNTEVALAGYSVVAEEGVTPSFVNQLKEAIQAKGISLDGTSGKTITICAPDAVKFYSDAYKISLVDGEDIVIEGGSQEMIGEAIELLITTLTDTGFYMSSIGYEKKHVYEQADLAINGELVKDYKIVANTNVFGAKVAADYLQKEIQEKTGRKLAIVSQTSGPAFVIDIKTNDEGKYFIDSEGSTITLSGAGANGAYTAAKALVNEIGDETSLTVADSSAAMFTLENTAYLLKNGETLKAAMWGDSVGEASGCIAPAVLLKEKLSQAFPGANVTMNNASLGGRHTAWGVYHIDEAIIDKGDLDLVMISLGTNDAPYAIKYEQTLLNYQSMIEKIRKANPNADIVFLMYGRIEEVYAMKNGNEVAYMKAMFEIADYYDIPIVDTVHKMDELTGASKNKDYKTNAAWQTYYKDMVHPNQDGYNLYADIYYQSIEAAIDASAGTKMEEHAMPTPMNKNSKIDTQRYYADLEEVPATAELIGLTYEDGWAQNGWSYAENSTASFTFTGTGLELYLEKIGEPKYKVVITDEEGAVVFDSGEKTYNSWWYDPQLTLSYGTYNVVVTHLNGSAENKLRITYINVVGATKTPQPTYLDTNLPDTLSDLSTNYDGSPMTADSVLERFEASREELGEEVTVIKEVSIADYPEVLNKKQVFVSATRGNDAYEGTVTKPFATLGAALAAMENEGGGIIWVEGGKYATTRPVVINSKHSGTKETPLFIIGYGADPVVFVGGKIIDSTSFKKVDPATDEVAARLKASVQDKVYSVDLSSWTREDVVLAGGKIIINDETYDLARFPNAYTDAQRTQNIDNTSLPYVSYAWDKGSMSDAASTQYQEWVDRVNNSGGTLTLESEIPFDIELANASGASYDVSEIYNWVNTGNIFISGSVYAHWHSKSYQLSEDCVHNGNKLGLDKGAGRYSIKSVKPEQYGARALETNHLYIYNAIEALDAPGEWFIDIDTMKLYVYPTENAGDITSAEVLYTGKVPTPENGEYKTNESGVITFRGEGTHKGVTEPVEYVVIDNIDIGASFSGGYRVNYAKNIVIQNVEVRNTNEEGVHFSRSFDSALIHSVLHRDVKISYYSKVFTTDLVPSNIFIQNNKFYEPAIGRQYAITIEDGVRAVISHNDFKDCCIILSGLEHIIEYNEFQGGSRDVADGGMVYVVDGGKMGYHVRYNVFHMFNTSKRAIYNDRKASGNYAYGNLINVRGSKMGEPLNPWYSSSGHGNVCVENVIVLRDYEEEFLPLDTTTRNGYGDCVFESTLYYYYKDSENGSDSAASELISGSRMGQKELDLLVNGPVYDSYGELASYSPEAIRKRFPDYVSYLETVRLILAAYNGDLDATYEKPTYDVAEAKGVTYTYKAPTDLKIYVPEHQYKLSGIIKTAQARTIEASKDTVLTFTYEELSAIERLWRQGAKLVVQDNVIIGGGYVDGGHGGSVTKDTAQRKTIRIDATLEKGYIEGMSIIDNNYIEQGVSVMPGIADGGYSASDYEISDAAWNTIAQSVSSVEGLKKQNYKSAGRTYVEFAE